MKLRLILIFVFVTSISFAQMKPKAAPPAILDKSESTLIKDSNIWEVFQNRRSVRNFKPDAIPVEWPTTPSKKNLNDFIVFEKF